MIKNIFFILFASISFSVLGQNNGATIHVFQPGQHQLTEVTPAHRDSIRKQDKNCIKWNWSLLTRGVFLINYEVYLTGKLTAEIGAGITYRDFLFEATKSFGGDTIDNFSLGSGSSASYGSPSPSYCVEGGLRYYTGDFDNMEGFFLEGDVSYRNYSFPNSTFTTYSTDKSYVPGYKFLDAQFKFGYVTSHWWNDLVSEFYIGIALRSATVNLYETINNYSYPYPYNMITKPYSVKSSYPQALLGFKIGYPF